MRRGHIRVGRGFGKEQQEQVLQAAGVTTIYVDQLAAAIRSLRQGDELFVVGLRGLAGSKAEIKAAVEEIHDKGACATDAATGRRSDGRHGVALMAEAAVDLSNERMGGHRDAKKFGRKGGKVSGKNRADRKTPLSTAQKHWYDLSLSNELCMEKINSYGYPDDWTYGALYAKWGKRGAQTGRPSSKKS